MCWSLNRQPDQHPDQHQSTSWSTLFSTLDQHLDQQSVDSRRTVNWLICTNWKLVTQLSTNCGLRCQWSHRWSVNRASIKCQLSSIERRVKLDRRRLLVLMIYFISNMIYVLKQASHFSFVIVNKVFVLLSETGYLCLQFSGPEQSHWFFSFFSTDQHMTLEHPHSTFYRVPCRVSFRLLCVGVMANQIMGLWGGGRG